eukprot:CAMPEP_0114695928 /NCGR_PEP_ID=MMETSP0191-20121206/71958_1 /TAXON_ID=126664 /ORGANISM="Sorites sp." /LENGTH=90 /DNA_ID=CAMNT_0001992881 /DNA_START=13 /DNA_END=285 /DNA_ORIENTATION=+
MDFQRNARKGKSPEIDSEGASARRTKHPPWRLRQSDPGRTDSSSSARKQTNKRNNCSHSVAMGTRNEGGIICSSTTSNTIAPLHTASFAE